MPTRTFRLLGLLVLASLLFGPPASAQPGGEPAAMRLVPPVALSDEPFSGVTHVVELSRDRLLVADEKENRLALVDLASGAVRTLGRVGSGPREYRAIGPLFARPGGGAYLSDFVQRRLLPIRDDGTFENPIAVPGSILLRDVDPLGVLYGEMFLPRERLQRSDSMFIVRWKPGEGTIDTLMQYDAGVTRWVIPAGAPRPVNPPVDTWAVLPAGDILVLDARAYRAVVFRDGRAVRSAAIPWQPVRVTAAEREAYLRAAAAAPQRRIGAGGGAPAAMPAPTYEFPEAYPPFGGAGLGGRYALRSPRGHVWIERLRAANDSTPRYDVLDAASGAFLGAISLTPRSRLVGFGREDGVYTVVRDDDDIQRIRRHPYPSLTSR
ncbi:MAG TPA: hypothetical protein VLE53_16145 [Gemmatimonadaceae bacterium]|nr:hypothetical protein [Gemmatimonadaceae bacterium]